MEPSRKNGHDRSNSAASSVIYNESTRNSIDLIESTTQQYKKKSDAHIQRYRWDAFFEPQYSFGAFIHGLNQEEEKQVQKHMHKKKIDQLVDGEPVRRSMDVVSSTVSTAIMTPTLPTQVNQVWGPQDENKLIERLELLKKMRASSAAIKEEEDEVDHFGPLTSKRIKEEASQTTARWKRSISMKAKQLYKEAKENDSRSSISSVDPDEDIEKAIEEEPTKKYGCRRSFLCFLLGFIFPPIWLFGAFYFSAHANKQTSASRRIDRVWRRRSRIAFGIFLISLMIIFVIIFVLKPGSVGWRLSKEAN